MNQRRFSIGPGAASLIMVIVVLSTSALGILALMNARNDLSLSRRSLAVAEEIYELNERAENSLALLDGVLAACAAQTEDQDEYLTLISAALPEEMALAGRSVSWEERNGDNRVLYCTVELSNVGQTPRVRWKAHKLAAEAKEMGMDDGWN